MKNKKLFAILTLVAFMLTMMPVMAFATTTSDIGVWVEDGSAKACDCSGTCSKASHKAEIGIDFPKAGLETDETVYVFAVVAGTNEVYGELKNFDGTQANFDDVKDAWIFQGKSAKDAAIKFTNKKAVDLEFKAVLVRGTSTIMSAVEVMNKANSALGYYNIAFDGANKVKFTSATNKDNVFEKPEIEVYKAGNNQGDATVTGDAENGYKVTQNVNANNGVDYFKVTAHLTNGESNVKNADIDVTVNKAGAKVSEETVTTNSRGIAKFNVFASKAGTYTVTLSQKDAEDIEIEFTFGTASTGSVTPVQPTGHYAVDHEFKIDLDVTDANGNALFGDDAKNAVIAGDRSYQFSKVPADSDFETEQSYEIDENGGGVTLDINKNTNKATLKITPNAEGEYTLKIFNNVTGADVKYVNFSAKEFDKAVKVELKYANDSYALGSVTTEPSLTLIDKNGTKLNETNKKEFAYTGVGVEKFDKNTGVITFSKDDKFMGKEVVVNVIAEKCFATTTLTIADAPAYLSFDKVSGGVGTEIEVPVKTLDLSGKPAALGNVDNAEITTTYVVTGSPEGAVVSVDTAELEDKTKLAKKGNAVLKVASNKEGTVTVNVIVKVTTKDEKGKDVNTFLTGIATVEVGKATPTNASATLIIGSNIFVANGGVQVSDVAPVIKAGRTYLPIRALSEALGANVEYADGVITITLGTQKATMTVGSNVMTINGETKTVDATPYITDGRTMVPVRAAAEALGYSLGITSNADGTTATVTIYNK